MSGVRRSSADDTYPEAPSDRRVSRGLRRALVILGAIAIVATFRMSWFPPVIDVRLVEFAAEGNTFVVTIPWHAGNAVLLEDDVPLSRCADLSRCGDGGYHVLTRAPPVFRFRTSDGSNPALNGRVYTAAIPRTEDPAYSNKILAIGVVGIMLMSCGCTTLRRLVMRPSPMHLRPWVVILALLPAIVIGLRPSSWSSAEIYPDTRGYVEAHSIRTVGYPMLIRTTSARTNLSGVPLNSVVGPDSGFVSTVRTQKILVVFAMATFGFLLLRRLGALETCVLLFWASWVVTTCDAANFGWDAVLTGPLSHAIAFLLFGLVFLFDDRSTWRLGLGVGVLVFAAVLVRPSNQVLFAVFPVLALAGVGDWRHRLRRLAPGFCVAVALMLGYMSWNVIHIGYFGVAPFMQFNLMGKSLELAEPKDVQALDDPALRAFLEACLRDGAEAEVSRSSQPLDYLNLWIYRIAPRHLPELVVARQDPSLSYFVNRERVSGDVNRFLLPRHTGRYFAQVWTHMTEWTAAWWIVLLGMYATWLLFVGALGSNHRGFVAATATLYLANLILYCALNVPLVRYLDIWELFLTLGLAVHAMDLVHAIRVWWRPPQTLRSAGPRDLVSQA